MGTWSGLGGKVERFDVQPFPKDRAHFMRKIHTHFFLVDQSLG